EDRLDGSCPVGDMNRLIREQKTLEMSECRRANGSQTPDPLPRQRVFRGQGPYLLTYFVQSRRFAFRIERFVYEVGDFHHLLFLHAARGEATRSEEHTSELQS